MRVVCSCVIILLMQFRLRLIFTPCFHVLLPWCCDAPSARVAHHFSPVLPACCCDSCGSSIFLLYSSSSSASSCSPDSWTLPIAWISRFLDLTCGWCPIPELWCAYCVCVVKWPPWAWCVCVSALDWRLAGLRRGSAPCAAFLGWPYLR